MNSKKTCSFLQGFTWIKVIARNSKGLDLCSEGSQQFGQKSILDQADQFLACGSQNQNFFQVPTIKFAFYNDGLSPQLRNALESKGIVVIQWPQDLPEHSAGESSVLNLDITAMVAYVSSLTNGHCKYIFKEQVLSDQARREATNPVKVHLDNIFEGKKLICCQSAADDFRTITKALAGPEELARAEELLNNRLEAIVPDQLSERFQGLDLSGKIKHRSLAIFGTGDHLKLPTVTANVGFVRAAKGQGIDLAAIVHESRALTESKMDAATPID